MVEALLMWRIDYAAIAGQNNALDIIEFMADRGIASPGWRFPFFKCEICKTGMITSGERAYADCPGTSCNGCIYSYLDPVEEKKKARKKK